MGGAMGGDGECVQISVVEPGPLVNVGRQGHVEADPRDHDSCGRGRRGAGKRQPRDDDDQNRLTE